MPIYVYEVVTEGGEPRRFEVFQRMADPPLTEDPETGEPVRRVLTPPIIPGRYSDTVMKQATSNDRRLEQAGFTKYVKCGDGYYEKRAGKGPKEIIK